MELNTPGVVKQIEEFLDENEASCSKTNIIIMSQKVYESLRKEAPYLIDGKYYFSRGLDPIKIVLTDDEGILGAGLVYFTELGA